MFLQISLHLLVLQNFTIEFRSQGYKVSKDTIFNYISHLEDAYTLFTVPIYKTLLKREK